MVRVLDERFFVGVDLGQSIDSTAISVLHRRRIPADGKFVLVDERHKYVEKPEHNRFDVRYLERLPLGMPYPAQCAHVGDLLAREPLNENTELVIDETGVGRPVGDIFKAARMKFIGVTITAGHHAERQGFHPERWHVPKHVLISQLDARLNTAELRFAKELREAPAMADELQNFRRHVSAAGRFSYEARSGQHDDLVLSVAIALWRAVENCLSFTMTEMRL